jgi:hypothetical protein
MGGTETDTGGRLTPGTVGSVTTGRLRLDGSWREPFWSRDDRIDETGPVGCVVVVLAAVVGAAVVFAAAGATAAGPTDAVVVGWSAVEAAAGLVTAAGVRAELWLCWATTAGRRWSGAGSADDGCWIIGTYQAATAVDPATATVAPATLARWSHLAMGGNIGTQTHLRHRYRMRRHTAITRVDCGGCRPDVVGRRGSGGRDSAGRRGPLPMAGDSSVLVGW